MFRSISEKMSNEFGLKLLKKFGWNEGEGLGIKSDGITKHIRVARKNDNKGIGFVETDYSTTWISHMSDFESCLAELNSKRTDKQLRSEQPNSNAEISTKKQLRKPTRLIDVTGQSLEDLKCIIPSATLIHTRAVKMEKIVEDQLEPIKKKPEQAKKDVNLEKSVEEMHFVMFKGSNLDEIPGYIGLEKLCIKRTPKTKKA